MFIAVEGIDGTGKSTQAQRIAEYLRSLGKDVILTKEPGGWEGGAALRTLVLSGTLSHRWSEAYIFMLDRAEHVAKVINPAIAKGSIVVCERYHASTVAYQVWGRGLAREPFDMLFSLSEFPVPDITFLFDMEPKESLMRVKARGALDNFESEGLEFMNKIRQGYLAQFAENQSSWIKISAEGTEDEVFERVAGALREKGVA